jgi:hypothetical protein
MPHTCTGCPAPLDCGDIVTRLAWSKVSPSEFELEDLPGCEALFCCSVCLFRYARAFQRRAPTPCACRLRPAATASLSTR